MIEFFVFTPFDQGFFYRLKVQEGVFRTPLKSQEPSSYPNQALHSYSTT